MEATKSLYLLLLSNRPRRESLTQDAFSTNMDIAQRKFNILIYAFLRRSRAIWKKYHNFNMLYDFIKLRLDDA